MLTSYLTNWGRNPYPEFIKKSKQFNQSDITGLTLPLSVNEVLSLFCLYSLSTDIANTSSVPW